MKKEGSEQNLQVWNDFLFSDNAFNSFFSRRTAFQIFCHLFHNACMLLQTRTLFSSGIADNAKKSRKAEAFWTRRTFRNCYVYLLSCKYFAWITESGSEWGLTAYICVYTSSGVCFFSFVSVIRNLRSTHVQIAKSSAVLSCYCRRRHFFFFWFGRLKFVLFDVCSIQSISLSLSCSHSSVYAIVSMFHACVCFFPFINLSRSKMTNVEANEKKNSTNF